MSVKHKARNNKITPTIFKLKDSLHQPSSKSSNKKAASKWADDKGLTKVDTTYTV